MNKSENINELALALSEFQSKCPKIELTDTVKVKLKTGGEYSFKYAPMGYITGTVKPILHECGLCYSQPLESSGVTTIIMHKSGQWISGTVDVELKGRPAQEMGSLITYMKRYSLCAILGIVADEDDDANSHDGNGMQKAAAAKPKTATNAPALSFTPAMKQEIENAFTPESLKAIWEKYGTHHQVKEFKDALTNRRLELTA